jgi:hypothetical protein
MATVKDLESTEYPSYFQGYISKVGDTPLLQGLEEGKLDTISFFITIPVEKQLFRYAEGKWTPKEILLHLIDSERMFCFRALSFARSENADLPGFDENEFAANSHANERSVDDLINEFVAVRDASVELFRSFSNDIMKQRGRANNNVVSVRACGFLICGHEIHHREIIRERYL